jgi:hypothetical protein
MPSRVMRLPMPEGGAERDVWFDVHHNCPQGKALRVDLGEDVDLIEFPVGHAGMGIPGNTPFVVTAVNDCRACGKLLSKWFEWAAPRLFVP